jgi:hypothetical protein
VCIDTKVESTHAKIKIPVLMLKMVCILIDVDVEGIFTSLKDIRKAILAYLVDY